jgi:EF-P beta-lysylation protein EpmB
MSPVPARPESLPLPLSSPLPSTLAAVGEVSWQRSLALAIRDPEVLLAELGLHRNQWPGSLAQVEAALADAAQAEAAPFPLLVPRSYLARMTPGDPRDPLLLQVLPRAEEFDQPAGFVDDAVGDAAARVVPGLLHKYAGRALLIVTGACAIHCRYCFRRQYPYGSEPKRLEDWQPALDYLVSDRSIQEVLLSGGDPLLWNDDRLAWLVDRLAAMPHLRRLRIHTRLPVVLPDRVTPALIALLRASRLTPFVVIHANHAQELVADAAYAVRELVRAGISVLNQAVLLRGVNDSVDALAALCERLVDLGVLPYYLHQLDRVRGTSQFEVPVEEGLRIVAGLRSRLPGYALPEYVRETPGQPHKTPLA